MEKNELTSRGHWDRVWGGLRSPTIPSCMKAGRRNFRRLLRSRVRRGDRFLEIGCAPGKELAWVAKVLGARVSGIDYSRVGIERSRELFQNLGIDADLRCEDVLATSFQEESFDVVYSAGVVEHLQSPSSLIRVHVNLVRPGGIALITIPNYRGLPGRIVRYFRPDVAESHNLDIMDLVALRRLAPLDLVERVDTFGFGHATPENIWFENRWPWIISKGTRFVLNAIGLMQPCDISFCCPMLVLELTRNR